MPILVSTMPVFGWYRYYACISCITCSTIVPVAYSIYLLYYKSVLDSTMPFYLVSTVTVIVGTCNCNC